MTTTTDLSAPWTIPHSTTASTEDIFYCFRLLLGRSPHLEEWPGHSAFAGTGLDSVVASYISSLEYSRRVEQIVAAQSDAAVSLVKLADFSIYVQDSDLGVGRQIKTAGSYEPHVAAVFRNFLKPGMNVLDIGANIGFFTMLSAALVGAKGSVLAVEPNSSNTKLIEASRRANAFSNITIVQAAAGNAIALLALHSVYSNGTTSEASENLETLMQSTTVPCLRIDDLLPKGRSVDFIKIDVEGAEYNALRGASEAIRRYRPHVVSEFSPEMMPGICGIDGATYLEFLVKLGYTLEVIEGDGRLVDCGIDTGKVMKAYEASGVDHIDIFMRGGHPR